MHYSIIIQGQPTNGSFTWLQGNYKFKNPYITMMKVLFTPDKTTTAAFSNIDTQNIITNGKGEQVVFDQGYYTLAEILAMLNEMQYCGFSITTANKSFGCIHITTSTTIDFSKAPDIREILGIPESNLPASIYDGKSIIDITRNRQVIQVFCSIVRTSDLKIANQNNNLLTTMMFDDPQATYLRKIEDVCIPICNRFDKLYFSFKDLDGHPMKLTGQFELQLTIDDVVEKQSEKDDSKLEKLSQFSITQVCNTPKTVVKLENPLSFKQCYISAISLYTDFMLFNVASDQVVKVYGNKEDATELSAEIEIPRGQYTIEELLALLNCSDSLFELIYYGENAFRICISDFNYIDFKSAQVIKTILGIDNDIITEAENQQVRFPLDTTCNKISVTNKVSNRTETFELQTGLYSWNEFVQLLAQTIKAFINLEDTIDHEDYVEFIAKDDFFFNRTDISTLNTIQNYYWLKWYTLTSSIQSNLLEKPDLDILNPAFKSNDAFWIEPDLCMCIVPETLLTMDYVFYWNTWIKVTINKVTQQFNFTGNFSTQQVCDSLVAQIKEKFSGVSVNLTTVNGNPCFQFSDLTTVFEYPTDFPLPTYSSKFDTKIEYKFNVKETYIKDLQVTHHDFLDDIKLDITIKNNTTQQSIAVTQVIPAGHYTSEQFVTKIASFINDTAKTVGVNNAKVSCWNGRANQKVVYGGTGITWTLKPQHYQDYYIINNNTNTYYAYDSPHLPKWYIRINPNHTPIRKYDLNVTIPEGFQYGDLQGDGLFNKLIHGLYNGSKKVNSTEIIPLSYWDNRFVWSTGGTKVSVCFTQYKNTIIPSFTDKMVSFGNPQTANTYIWMNDDKWKASGKTAKFIYTLGDKSRTMNIAVSSTQQKTIESMNLGFTTGGYDLLWTPSDQGYKLLLHGGTCGGTFFTIDYLGIDKMIITPSYILWPYTFKFNSQNCRVTQGYYLSDNPVDITNNLSTLKLYCNIVKSRTKPLLCNIPIDDLSKNYFYKNRLVIPCTERLDQLEYEFRDENDKEIPFLGNIYLLVTFTTQQE